MGKNKGKRKRVVQKEFVNNNKRTVRTEDPNSYYDKTPVWKFDKVDFLHQKWSIEKCDVVSDELFKKLKGFEGIKWKDIISTSGGRKNGNNHHSIDFSDMIKEAQDRAEEIRIAEYGQLFSLRLAGKVRLFGILQDGVFSIVWFDHEHEICPVTK